jgi:hypothetical protein
MMSAKLLDLQNGMRSHIQFVGETTYRIGGEKLIEMTFLEEGK